MEIKAAEVKELRAKTGAGMMDCKKALVESAGNFQRAVTILKELGLAAAAKRSGKAANEGRVFAKVGESRAGLLEFSSETDFVARNKEFIEAGEKLIGIAVENGSADEKIHEVVESVRSRLKENISLKRIDTIDVDQNEVAVHYIHGEGKIGVIVKIATDGGASPTSEVVQQFAFDCALHVAAYNPAYLTRDDIEASYIAEQEAIYRKQTKEMEKPEKVIEGIIKGKLNKHLAEVVFVEQGFVKEEKTKVADVAKRISKEVGGEVRVSDYRYFRVGDTE